MFIEGQTKVEKRRFRRVSFKEAIRFQLKDSSQFGGCLAHDISEGGIRINFNDFIPIKSEMVLQMKPPGIANVLDFKGRVAWQKRIAYSDRYQVGMEFINVDPISKEEIRTYIKSRRF